MTKNKAIDLAIQTESNRLQNIIQAILAQAKILGASQAAVSANINNGFGISVRMGDVETVEYNRDSSVGVTVYFGKQKGFASTSDMRSDAIAEVVQAACAIAKVTTADKWAGLADSESMAWNFPQLKLFYPWSITPKQAIDIALECEKYARSLDPCITNSEGVGINTQQSLNAYANSHGFFGIVPTTYHGISCSLVAKDDTGMQRDYDYSSARDAEDLHAWQLLAERAAKRVLRRLGAKPIKTCQVPVIFEAPIASSLLRSFISAISGSSLYRKSSFLLDTLGEQLFLPHVHIHQRPHLVKGLGSTPFDGEGVATKARDYVTQGILQSYVLGSYSARRLGMQSTGNSGGVFNLTIESSNQDLADMLKMMDKGLLVTELMGQGVNLVTGDYSRGAVGFWIEHGEIQYPVEQITIAGNLRQMFKQLQCVGSDVDLRGNIHTGSILIEQMTVAGIN